MAYIPLSVPLKRPRNGLQVSLWGPYKARGQNGVSGSSCMPSLNLERTKRQRSGHVYHTLLLRKVYYSSRLVEHLHGRDVSSVQLL